MMLSSFVQPVITAPTSARAAMLRNLIVFFILLFVLVGLLLFFFIVPVVVLHAGLAIAASQDVALVM